MTKPFSELTEDEKMAKLYDHFIHSVSVTDGRPDGQYFLERYHLVEFAREKLEFLRAFHRTEKSKE